MFRECKKVFVVVKTLHGLLNSSDFVQRVCKPDIRYDIRKMFVSDKVRKNEAADLKKQNKKHYVMLTVAATPAAASLPLMSPLPYFHARQMDLWKAVTWIIPPLSHSLSRKFSNSNSRQNTTYCAGRTRSVESIFQNPPEGKS